MDGYQYNNQEHTCMMNCIVYIKITKTAKTKCQFGQSDVVGLKLKIRKVYSNVKPEQTNLHSVPCQMLRDT